jgi:hypothetical protein
VKKECNEKIIVRKKPIAESVVKSLSAKCEKSQKKKRKHNEKKAIEKKRTMRRVKRQTGKGNG